jgi:hypothetical protein
MRTSIQKKLGKIAVLAIVITFFTFSVASSAEFYNASLFKITPISGTGDVNVQFKSVASPPQWDDNARGTVFSYTPGASTINATLLTAFSLGYNISIQTEETPSFDNVQEITAVSVVAP